MITAARAGHAGRAGQAIAAAVIVALLTSPVAAQVAPAPGIQPELPPNLPRATETEAKTNTDAVVTSAKSQPPSCAVVAVSPAPVRADGNPWDTIAAEPPDIRIAETTTGSYGECDDTWSCSITVTPTVSMLELILADTDSIGGDDLMGSGTCAIGKICDFGLARVAVKAC